MREEAILKRNWVDLSFGERRVIDVTVRESAISKEASLEGRSRKVDLGEFASAKSNLFKRSLREVALCEDQTLKYHSTNSPLIERCPTELYLGSGWRQAC